MKYPKTSLFGINLIVGKFYKPTTCINLLNEGGLLLKQDINNEKTTWLTKSGIIVKHKLNWYLFEEIN